MDTEFTILEERLTLLLQQHESLQKENAQLRSRANQLVADNKRLQDKLDQVSVRVQAALAKLPE